MPIADDTIARIKDMILAGELKPGQRLPREADLAEKVGASRNALREAVRALAAMRILTVRQGDGTYVTSLEPSLLMEVMGFAVDFHQDDSVLHSLEVRRVMEPGPGADRVRGGPRYARGVRATTVECLVVPVLISAQHAGRR